jgi:Peptidase M15
MRERSRNFIVLFFLFFFFKVALASDFDPDRAKFNIRYNGDILPYEIMSLFVLPNEALVFELPDPPSEDYEITVPEGMLVRLGREKWSWRAPQDKGLYRIKVANRALKESVTLNLFVMVPANQLTGEYLNGYHIGKYPPRALKNNPIYRPPKGFVEVTKANRDTRISPHFKLKQFVSKQQSDYPMYVILQEKLLLKLELILESVNALGHESDTLHIMSGYRTPFYNKAIGNVQYSLHQWGGAADIFVDDDENRLIDDLNKDRRIDFRDADVLRRIIEALQKDPQHKELAGGLGLYSSTTAHGPFVHVDVRGHTTRWQGSPSKNTLSYKRSGSGNVTRDRAF